MKILASLIVPHASSIAARIFKHLPPQKKISCILKFLKRDLTDLIPESSFAFEDFRYQFKYFSNVHLNVDLTLLNLQFFCLLRFLYIKERIIISYFQIKLRFGSKIQLSFFLLIP